MNLQTQQFLNDLKARTRTLNVKDKKSLNKGIGRGASDLLFSLGDDDRGSNLDVREPMRGTADLDELLGGLWETMPESDGSRNAASEEYEIDVEDDEPEELSKRAQR